MQVTPEEREMLLKKPLIISKHFYQREFQRLKFRELETIVEQGIIEKEGKNKYKASMQFGNKIKFVIFADCGDYLKLITADETSR